MVVHRHQSVADPNLEVNSYQRDQNESHDSIDIDDCRCGALQRYFQKLIG